MPPKKAQQPNKKTEQKKKEKIIEDKTFGLKNKKGNKQQNYIKSVQHQVKYGNQKASKVEDQKEKEKKLALEKKKKEQDELNKLFRPAQKVSKGVDPKSVVCSFFKQGSCTKGDKCKFSHDLTLQRKAEKRSIYEDGGEQEADTMDSWDEEKLKEVVNKKHGEADKKHPKTNIVCKYFVKALEDMKYGWFWTCPNGEKCMYKHTLPPGFVLKKAKKDETTEEEKISLEELIEQERAKIGANHTKITLESFQAWKKKKIEEKKKKLAAEMSKKKQEFKQGKSLGITGRELFQFNPDMIMDADTEGDDVFELKREEDDEGGERMVFRDLTAEALAAEAKESDNSGTVSTSSKREGETSSSLPKENSQSQNDEESKLGAAAALSQPVEGSTADGTGDAGAACPMVNGAASADLAVLDVEVDEDLFGQELDNVDEELENLDLD